MINLKIIGSNGRFRNTEINKWYQELQTACHKKKQFQIDKLIKSMPHSCTKVIKNNVYAINY